MMYYYGQEGMFGGGGGIFCALVALVVLVDLILVGVWLWQHISHK